MFFAFSNVADGGRYFFFFYFFKRIDVFLILDNSRKILYPSEVKNFIHSIYYRNEEREEIPPILKHYIFKTCASFIYEFVIATTICYCIFVFFAVSNIGKQCVLYVACLNKLSNSTQIRMHEDQYTRRYTTKGMWCNAAGNRHWDERLLVNSLHVRKLVKNECNETQAR